MAQGMNSATHRQIAENEPDIRITHDELKMGTKAVLTSCMRIKKTMVEPVSCLSKTGISSSSMFGSGEVKQRPQSAQQLQDYAALFHKYYGPESLIDRMVSQSKAAASTSEGVHISALQRPHSAHDARIDREIEDRAQREMRAKYITPYIAAKYKLDGEGSVPLSNPARQGLTMVPNGGVLKEATLNAADAAGAAKVMEMVSLLEEGDQQKAARVAAIRQRNSKTVVAQAEPPQPSTSSFKTTSRAQASKSGRRDGSSGPPDMGPGKYANGTSRYFEVYARPHVPNLQLVPKQTVPREAGSKEAHEGRDAEWMSEEEGEAGAAAHTTGRRTTDHDRPGSGRPSTSPRHTEEAHAQGKVTALDLFKGAHQVHGKKPSKKEGTQAFKAIPRPKIEYASTGGHLALKYFNENYDDFLKKPPKLITGFEKQTKRPPMLTAADTPPSLGPGSYLDHDNAPSSLTGRHVAAGHTGHMRGGAIDFGKSSYRPGSAPPRPAHIPEVTAAEGAYALHTLYGAGGRESDPSHLLSIMALESHAEQGPGGRFLNGGRPATARPASAGPRVVVQDAPRKLMGTEQANKFSSTGFAKRVPGGKMSENTRAKETMGLRAMSRDGVVPPAATKTLEAVDVMYEPDDTKMAHRHRAPGWKLPPNRNAQSKAWIASAALAYM